MKFKLLVCTAVILMAVGCSKDAEQTGGNAPVENPENEMVPIRVHMSGFTVTQEAIAGTRGTQAVEDYAGVKVIDLVFFNADGSEAYRQEQDRSVPAGYTTFGEFACQLPVGHYTMVAVARGRSEGDNFTLSSPEAAGYTSERARETLTAVQSVTVTSGTPTDLDVTLKRVVAKLRIVSNDNRSASCTKIRTTYAAGGKSFNPTTGQALTNTGVIVTNSPSSLTSVAPVDVISYIFLDSDEQTMDITIEALDANNDVLSTKVAKDVSLKRNRCTILSGDIFSTTASAVAFKVESWLDDYNAAF